MAMIKLPTAVRDAQYRNTWKRIAAVQADLLDRRSLLDRDLLAGALKCCAVARTALDHGDRELVEEVLDLIERKLARSRDKRHAGVTLCRGLGQLRAGAKFFVTTSRRREVLPVRPDASPRGMQHPTQRLTSGLLIASVVNSAATTAAHRGPSTATPRDASPCRTRSPRPPLRPA